MSRRGECSGGVYPSSVPSVSVSDASGASLVDLTGDHPAEPELYDFNCRSTSSVRLGSRGIGLCSRASLSGDLDVLSRTYDRGRDRRTPDRSLSALPDSIGLFVNSAPFKRCTRLLGAVRGVKNASKFPCVGLDSRLDRSVLFDARLAVVGGVAEAFLIVVRGRGFGFALDEDAGVVRIHLSGSGRYAAAGIVLKGG